MYQRSPEQLAIVADNVKANTYLTLQEQADIMNIGLPVNNEIKDTLVLCSVLNYMFTGNASVAQKNATANKAGKENLDIAIQDGYDVIGYWAVGYSQ
jgi:hypothetical protein